MCDILLVVANANFACCCKNFARCCKWNLTFARVYDILYMFICVNAHDVSVFVTFEASSVYHKRN